MATKQKPKPVREAEERAEALLQGQQQQEEEGEQDSPEGAGQDPQQDETPAESEQPAAKGETGDELEQAQQQADEGHYYQAWLTLKGKYNAEIDRLNRQLRELQQERDQQRQKAEQLQQQIEQLQSAQPQGQPEGQTQEPQDAVLSEEEKKRWRDEFGDEFVQAIERMSEARVQSLRQELEQLKAERQQDQQVSEQQRQERFWQDLQALVPDWERINKDSRFLQWLSETDPLAGKTRQQALDEASQALDARRVAQIFDAYRNQVEGSRDQELAKQVTPGRSKAEQPQQGPQYGPEDLVRLQKEYMQGKWRGREQEFQQKEREIHAALYGG